MIEAVFRIALKGRERVLSVSDGVGALLGYRPEEFLSGTVSLRERIHGQDADIAERLFDSEAQGGTEAFNIRLRHADGRIRCLRGSCTRSSSANEGPVMQVTLQDATNLREAPGSGNPSVNLKSVMESVDDCVYFKNRDHVITEANTNYCLALSTSDGQPRKVAGLTDYDLFSEEYADESYDLEKRIFGGMPCAHEVQEIIGKDGRRLWVDVRKFPVKNENGEMIGLFGITCDITDGVQSDKALRASEESLKEAQRIAGLGSYVLEIATGMWTSSEVLDEIFGIDENFARTVEGWKSLIHPDDRATMSAYLGDEVMGKSGQFSREYRIVRQKDGETRWVHGLGRLEFDDAGDPTVLRGTIQDITERKKAEERLQLAASVFTHASEGIVITDANGSILNVNDAFTRITGYSREEVLGRNPRILNSGRQGREFYTDMWSQLIRKGHWSGEIWNRAKSGQIYAEMLTISAVQDAAGNTQQYVAMFSDITSMKEQERQLERVAHYDMLTGLPNRVLLRDRLHLAMAQAHRRGRMVAVICLDLDNFKEVNDRHGHNTGDQLLTAVTLRMKEALHEDDTLARLGGDEFVAVMPEIESIDDSAPMISRLQQAVSEPVHVGELTLQVSGSIGVTYYPQAEDVDADQLLRQADQAMYHAKVEGKDRHHIFDPLIDRSVRGHHEDLERIRAALAANEFVLYYQPRVNMGTGAIVSAEALIRWQHPERGLLAPAQFLPVIEGHALAIELGEWVINSALTQMERWCAYGLDIPVSVNVAAQQLQQHGFVDRLSTLLGAHPGIAPSSLELEVLESSALQDVAQVSQVLRACSRLGVTFSLDDFGTGYSSLSYLKRLPVDVLKIDQTFVRDMLDDPVDLTILEGVLGLAKAFRRQAVAEGVETLEHGEMLLRLGCQVAQGYGIAHPMPASDLPQWVRTWQPHPQWVDVSPVDPADWPLLYGGVEHRAWVADIADFVEGRRQSAPELEHFECRFGAWLQLELGSKQDRRPGFADIDALHRRVHDLAGEILARKASERRPAAVLALAELHDLRDAFANRLAELVKTL